MEISRNRQGSIYLSPTILVSYDIAIYFVPKFAAVAAAIAVTGLCIRAPVRQV